MGTPWANITRVASEFGNPVSADDWLFEQTATSMFPPPPSGLDGAFDLGSVGMIASDSNMLEAYPSITPGEYFHPNALPHRNPNLSSPSMMQPPEPGRLYCTREGCTNTDGFSRRSDLRRHQQKHDKRHQCTECPSRFGSKADNQRHMREVHGLNGDNGKQTMYYCPVTTCKRNSRGFPRYWNMQQHHGKMHGGPMPPSPQTPQTSPTVCSMDTPRFSSGESAPNTPPSSVDEPNTPWMQSSVSNPTDDAARHLIMRRLAEIENKRQSDNREAAQLQAALHRLDRVAK